MGQRMAGSPNQVQVAADEQPTEKRSVYALAVASAASHDLVGDISAARMAISLASSAEVDTDKSVALLADAGDLLEVAQEQARATFNLLAASVGDPAATKVHRVGESLADAGIEVHLPNESDAWTSMNPLALTSAFKSVRTVLRLPDGCPASVSSQRDMWRITIEVPADAKGGRLLNSVCELASAAGGQWGVQGPVFIAEVPRCDPPETP
ncbi:MAG TPA: hypothetical protein DCE47_08435 [Planctomycetaceae bacterium]|nr:hypothetical protein [Planctomycetaceae bacterium]HCD00099.1 hypothetical protein [Planctomycetaceae bacterium]